MGSEALGLVLICEQTWPLRVWEEPRTFWVNLEVGVLTLQVSRSLGSGDSICLFAGRAASS